ncbi:unnamed protein product [Ambrosiozyma monospora]|uniref:Unnamed protein product n=1 Tax=Ambrosiozyma monospora TaxID=43982 RepID=A0A9W6Z1W6_AMBMO|nr:unnamed protein product [Ambrosiozyma monospora]
MITVHNGKDNVPNNLETLKSGQATQWLEATEMEIWPLLKNSAYDLVKRKDVAAFQLDTFSMSKFTLTKRTFSRSA